MAQMDAWELTKKAYMLLGFDASKWRQSDIPLVAQMVVDENPSFTHNKEEREHAKLTVQCRLNNMKHKSQFGASNLRNVGAKQSTYLLEHY